MVPDGATPYWILPSGEVVTLGTKVSSAEDELVLEVMLAQSFEHFELALETAGTSSDIISHGSHGKGCSNGGSNTNA